MQDKARMGRGMEDRCSLYPLPLPLQHNVCGDSPSAWSINTVLTLYPCPYSLKYAIWSPRGTTARNIYSMSNRLPPWAVVVDQLGHDDVKCKHCTILSKEVSLKSILTLYLILYNRKFSYLLPLRLQYNLFSFLQEQVFKISYRLILLQSLVEA